MMKSKPKNQKFIIIIGLVIISLIAVGLFFFFWKKSQNISGSSSSSEDNLPPNQDGNERFISQYSNYLPKPPSPNISEEEAKNEVIRAIWEWGAKEPAQRKVEKILLTNNSEMDYKEDKKLEKANADFKDEIDFVEKIMQKYQKDIFSNFPTNQSKFEAGIRETNRIRNFYLLYNDYLERKTNGEIDWKTTLKKCSRKNDRYDKISKSTAREDYKEIVNYIEREINPFLLKHGKEFPNLTNLEELNQWSNILAQKQSIAEGLLYTRWQLGKRIGKKSVHSSDVPTGSVIQKNQKLNLSHQLTIFMVRDL